MFRECSGYVVKIVVDIVVKIVVNIVVNIVVKIIVKVAVKIVVKICCQDLLSRLVVNIINIVNIFNMVNLTNIMISIPAQGLLNLCQIFFKSLSNLCQTFLDALASLGSMLESQSVTQSFMFLRFCQILGTPSGYRQGIVRVCSE